MRRSLGVVAMIAGLVAAVGCSRESPSNEASGTEPVTDAANASPRAAPEVPLDGPAGLYAGMHYANNVLDFNPADLPADWKQTLLPKLAAGTPLSISTSDGIFAGAVERAEITSTGTLKVHVRSNDSLRQEIVFVSLSRIAPVSWTTRGVTDEEKAFAKAQAKERFKSITGTAYTGPMQYTDQRIGAYTIDLDKLGFGAFVVETQKGAFLIMVFQLPGGESVGQVTAFHSDGGGEWRELFSFTDDFRARIPRIDVDGDGVPELLHSGSYDRGWDLAAFYPKVRPILRITSGA